MRLTIACAVNLDTHRKQIVTHGYCQKFEKIVSILPECAIVSAEFLF